MEPREPAPAAWAGAEEEGAPEARGYPRPQLRRAGWCPLNGSWDFALDPLGRWVHFGAVDHAATIWVNGSRCAYHEGGYTPFEVDITDLLHRDGPQEIVVRAEDDPAGLAKPRGKQDWQLEPHSIWNPRTTGIWQTVWHERVPVTRIEGLRWTPNLARWELGLEVHIEGTRPEGLRLDVHLHGRPRGAHRQLRAHHA